MLLVCFGELQFLFERYFCVHHMLMVLLQGMHVNDNYTCLCVVSTKFMNIQPPCPLMNKQFLGNQNGKRYTFKFLSEAIIRFDYYISINFHFLDIQLILQCDPILPSQYYL